MLTKGLSIHKNNYELLVDKIARILTSKGVSNLNISAVGGPCLAAGLANRVHSSVVIANKDIKTAKQRADMLNLIIITLRIRMILMASKFRPQSKIFFLWQWGC